MVPTAKHTRIIAATDLSQRHFVKLAGRWYIVLTPPVRVTERPYELIVQVITRENVDIWLPVYGDQVEVMEYGKVPSPWRPSKLRKDAERLESQAQGLLNRAGGLVTQARLQEYRQKG